jgi:Cys-tRNA(Pro) deacylase
MKVVTTVAKLLDDCEIGYTVKEHQNPAFSCEDVARERKMQLSQILKCMVGKDSNDNICVMLIPGDKTLEIKKVRQAAGGEKIKLISPKELTDSHGVIVGAISPMQFIGSAKFFLDKKVLEEDIVDISSGSPYAGVEVNISDLVRVISPTICDIASD